MYEDAVNFAPSENLLDENAVPAEQQKVQPQHAQVAQLGEVLQAGEQLQHAQGAELGEGTHEARRGLLQAQRILLNFTTTVSVATTAVATGRVGGVLGVGGGGGWVVLGIYWVSVFQLQSSVAARGLFRCVVHGDAGDQAGFIFLALSIQPTGSCRSLSLPRL